MPWLPIAIALALARPAPAPPPSVAEDARALLGELVAADSSNPPGNEARAVAIGARRLAAAGIPYEIDTFAKGRQNLVARLAGDGSARPLLLLAHVDVVGTAGQAWSTPPHRLTEVAGFLQGRGVSDDLGAAAIDLELLIWLKRSGVRLRRDVVVAWTGDEESGGSGIQWQLAHRPGTLDAEIALNEGGGPLLDAAGRVSIVDLEAAQKTYQDYTLEATGPTGHSSVPLPGNAIDRLAAALVRLADHPFPPRLLPVTRAYFSSRARLESGDLARALRVLAEGSGPPPAWAVAALDRAPSLAALLRTTCVATTVRGGSRVNALPASAEANVNCRILPDETPQQVLVALQAAVGDPGVRVIPGPDFGRSGPSPLTGAGPDAIRRAVAETWPGAAVVPIMAAWANDSRFLRPRGTAAYGLLPFPLSEADARRAHGVDERIPASALAEGLRFYARLVLDLAAAR